MLVLDSSVGRHILTFPTNGFTVMAIMHEGRMMFSCWDCSIYCLDAESMKLEWKFHTSLSYQSPINVEESQKAGTVWVNTGTTEIAGGREEQEGVSVPGYGTISSSYSAAGMTGYLSHKKKGYISK